MPENETALNYFTQGSNYFVKADYRQAEVFLEKALKIEPGNPEFRKKLADAYNDHGYYTESESPEEALALYKKAIDADPLHKQANGNLISFYEKNRDFDALTGHYESLISKISQSKKSGYTSEELSDIYNYYGNVLLDKKGDPAKAKDIYLKAISINPDNTYANRNLGLAYDRTRQTDLALEQFQKAIGILKKNDQAEPAQYADLYNDIGTVYQNKKNNPEEAQKYYLLALSSSPAHTAANRNLGVAYKASGQTDLALEQFKKAIDVLKRDDRASQQDYADLYNDIGIIYHNKREFEEAQKYYLLVLSSEPGHADANRNLALAYDAAGQTDLAIEQSQKAIELLNSSVQTDPVDYADLYNDLGCIYLDAKKDNMQAIEYFRKSLEKEPRHIFASRNLGLALYRAGKYNEAVLQYQKTLELLPKQGQEGYDAYKTSELLNDIGNAIVDTEEYGKALDVYTQALSLNNENKFAVYNLGYVSEKLGNTDKALEYYKMAIVLDRKETDVQKKFVSPYRQAAFLLSQQGLYADAFDILIPAEQYFSDSADSAEFLNDMGNLYFDVGQYSLAEDYYKKALTRQQDYALAQHNIAYRYEKCGNYETARAEWKKAFDLYDKTIPGMNDNDKALLLFYYAEAKFYSMLEEDLDTIENMYREILELEKM